jgi:putative NADH-flavin reductase
MHKDHKAAMELLEAAKDVDFTIVEPPQIVDAVQYGYTLREEGALPLSQLSYQDLAAFMLEVAESDKYKRKEIMICSAKPISR